MSAYEDPTGTALERIGGRAQQLRLARELRQDELASRAGVSIATVRRFEKTGNASLENVLRIATALRAELPFDALFAAPPFASIDDALERPERAKRRRAPRSK